MTDFSSKNRILVTCAKAMPPFLAAELRGLSFPVIREHDAAVETTGSPSDAMFLNLHLRTGHRVLYLLADFYVRTPDDLYRAVRGMSWHDYVPAGEYLCVHASVENPHITDPRFAVVKCKDAIVDRIRSITGRRPDSGPDQRGAVVYLYWRGNRASVFVDTSGEPLSRRGYRTSPVQAPLQETLAAGILLATGWDGASALVNPMCGSGTLAIEAALLATRCAPGLLRENFGFMHLQGFPRAAWEAMRAKARAARLKSCPAQIVASDADAGAVRAARQNAEAARVADAITFETCDFGASTVPPPPGVIVINPPYGERLGGDDDLMQTYFGIGDFFKQKCAGYRGYVFTGNFELAKWVGLRSKRRIPFFNSQIECRLLEYELYAGSRRTPKE